MNAAIAAAQVEAEVELDNVEPGEVSGWTVFGCVSWDPTQQEFTVHGLRVLATKTLSRVDNEVESEKGGDLPTKRHVEDAEVALISIAEKHGVGRCIGCVERGWVPLMADGKDWFCGRCRESAADAVAA